jgi:hypothetical protein
MLIFRNKYYCDPDYQLPAPICFMYANFLDEPEQIHKVADSYVNNRSISRLRFMPQTDYFGQASIQCLGFLCRLLYQKEPDISKEKIENIEFTVVFTEGKWPK